MKKILFFVFLNILPSGYSCPDNDPHKFTNWESSDMNFCETEAYKAGGGDNYNPNSIFKHCGGSQGAPYKTAALLLATDCGGLCMSVLNCFTEYWTTQITNTTNLFMQFYKALTKAENKVEELFKSNINMSNLDETCDKFKDYLSGVIAKTMKAQNPKAGGLDHAKEYVERRFQISFVHYSGIHGPWRDTLKKVLTAIYNNNYTEFNGDDKYTNIINHCKHWLATIIAKTSPTPQAVTNLHQALVNYFDLLENTSNLSGASISLCGQSGLGITQYLNSMIQIFFNPQNTSCGSTNTNNAIIPNPNIISQVAAKELSNLKKVLGLSEDTDIKDVKIEEAEWNSTQMNFLGITFNENQYILHHKKITRQVLALLSPQSPLLNVIHDYMSKYLEKCNKCSPGTTNLTALPIAESLATLYINLKGFHLLTKGIKKLRANTLTSRRINEINKQKKVEVGDEDAAADEDGVGESLSYEGDASAASKSSLDAAYSEGVVDVEKAAEGFAERATLVIGVVYMIASAICGKVAKGANAKYCDPIGLAVSDSIDYCNKMNRAFYQHKGGSQVTTADAVTYYADPAVFTACGVVELIGAVWNYVIAPAPKYIGDIVMGLCDAISFGTIASVCEGVGKDVTKAIDTAIDWTVHAVGTAINDINKGFDTFGNNIATAFNNLAYVLGLGKPSEFCTDWLLRKYGECRPCNSGSVQQWSSEGGSCPAGYCLNWGCGCGCANPASGDDCALIGQTCPDCTCDPAQDTQAPTCKNGSRITSKAFSDDYSKNLKNLGLQDINANLEKKLMLLGLTFECHTKSDESDIKSLIHSVGEKYCSSGTSAVNWGDEYLKLASYGKFDSDCGTFKQHVGYYMTLLKHCLEEIGHTKWANNIKNFNTDSTSPVYPLLYMITQLAGYINNNNSSFWSQKTNFSIKSCPRKAYEYAIQNTAGLPYCFEINGSSYCVFSGNGKCGSISSNGSISSTDCSNLDGAGDFINHPSKMDKYYIALIYGFFFAKLYGVTNVKNANTQEPEMKNCPGDKVSFTALDGSSQNLSINDMLKELESVVPDYGPNYFGGHIYTQMQDFVNSISPFFKTNPGCKITHINTKLLPPPLRGAIDKDGDPPMVVKFLPTDFFQKSAASTIGALSSVSNWGN